ncbi:polyprenyl synthetase family protein [Amphibacillus sp. Q70]|uniref:polyprenyl synthetase family protein n=1 Tax=Amphibacillus sp. Q70 TaxID=3453416 RepID=UPI003F871ECF
MEIHPIWHDYPKLNKHLLKVNQVIDTHIRIKDKKIQVILKETMNAGGKLLRPAYALLCSEIGPDYDQDKAIAIAAALETLHIATLVHDDVIDQADSRRGKATLHRLHDNKFAIYAGDYLFSVCFSILSKYSSSLSHVAYNSRSMEKILIGELDQLHSRFQPPKSVKSYLSRISGKTAQLFALSCYAGAVESHAGQQEIRHAWNMGHYIGMAFQIIDDILDYQGDMEEMGKPVMADVQQGIYTLPLIYAMLNEPEKTSAILAKERPFSDQDLTQLTMIISQAKGVEKAKRLAERYTSKALQQLDKLPDGNYKDTLRQLTLQILKRTT